MEYGKETVGFGVWQRSQGQMTFFFLCDLVPDWHLHKERKNYPYFLNQIKFIKSLKSEALFASEGFVVELCGSHILSSHEGLSHFSFRVCLTEAELSSHTILPYRRP